MFRIPLAIAFTLASLTVAAAAEQVTVPANKTSMVGHHVVYHRNTCDRGPVPQMRVGRKPEHGKVGFKTVTGKLKSGRCAGKVVKGTAVYYTPQKGFRGKDKFSVNFEYDYYEGAARRVSSSTSYNVTVK